MFTRGYPTPLGASPAARLQLLEDRLGLGAGAAQLQGLEGVALRALQQLLGPRPGQSRPWIFLVKQRVSSTLWHFHALYGCSRGWYCRSFVKVEWFAGRNDVDRTSTMEKKENRRTLIAHYLEGPILTSRATLETSLVHLSCRYRFGCGVVQNPTFQNPSQRTASAPCLQLSSQHLHLLIQKWP